MDKWYRSAMKNEKEPKNYKERYYAKMRKEGLTKMEIWVPRERREEVLVYAEKLRNEHKRANP